MTAEWDGRVTDVDGDTFTAILRREGQPEVTADFSMKHCGLTVEPGDLIIVTPGSVQRRDLGVWTQEEVDAIRARARERRRALGFTDDDDLP